MQKYIFAMYRKMLGFFKNIVPKKMIKQRDLEFFQLNILRLFFAFVTASDPMETSDFDFPRRTFADGALEEYYAIVRARER